MIAGEDQSPEVHAVVHYINQVLGNNGTTVVFTHPLEQKPVDQWADLQALVHDLNSGQVDLLLILGGNPVFNAPPELNLRGAIQMAKHARPARASTTTKLRKSASGMIPEDAYLRTLERRAGLRRHDDDHAAADCAAVWRQVGA